MRESRRIERRLERRGRLILVIGSLGLLVARIAVSTPMHGLVAVPDEAGFLGNAWFLGRGGPAPIMVLAPVYKVGYSLVLAPVASAFSTPHGVQTGTIVVNAILVTAIVPLLYRLVAHLGPATRSARAMIAVAAAALPAAWVAVPLARPDALLFLLVVLSVLALWSMVTPGPWWARVWFGPTVAWMWVTHDRFLPLLVIAALLLILRLIWPAPGTQRRFDAVNLLLLVLVGVAGWALNRWVIDVRWDSVVPGATKGLHFGQLGAMLRVLLGQWWYLIVSTYGLAAIGVASLAAEAWRGARRGRALWTDPKALASGFILLMLLGTQVATAVQLRVLFSFDLVANGRYQDVVVPVLVAVGLSQLLWWLALDDHVRPLVGAGVAMVVTSALLAATVHIHGLVETASISGIGWAVMRTPKLPILGALIVGLIGLGLLATVGRYQPRLMAVMVLVAFSVLGLYETHHVVNRSDPQPPSVELAAKVRTLPGVRSVSIDPKGDILLDSAAVSWRLAGLRTVDYDTPAGPSTDILLTSAGTNDVPPGARLIMLSSDFRSGAWSLPGAEQRRLARAGLLYPKQGASVPAADRVVTLRAKQPRVMASGGNAWLDVTVTNDGDRTVWPSAFAPGVQPVRITALSAEGRHISFALPELRPHESKLIHVQLGSLAPKQPGAVKVVLAVSQGTGTPLFTQKGTVPEVEVVATR